MGFLTGAIDQNTPISSSGDFRGHGAVVHTREPCWQFGARSVLSREWATAKERDACACAGWQLARGALGRTIPGNDQDAAYVGEQRRGLPQLQPE